MDSKADVAAKNAALKNIFLRYGDMTTVAKFVLGKNWRAADADVRANFTDAFTESLSKTWVRRFTEFSGKGATYAFKNVKTEVKSETGDVFVTTQVVPEDGGQPNTVVWRFKDAGGGLKMTDIIVEGVSMAMTYRNEFASVLARNGNSVDALIASLKAAKAGTQGK